MQKAFKKINATVQYISGASIVILMLMTVVDVFWRQLLGKPLSGVFELTPILLTLIVFFAVAYANDHKEHVVIDILYDALPKIGRKIFSYICTIINMAIVAVMFWQVVNYGLQLISRNAATSSLHIPMWPFSILAAVGILCYFLSLLNDLIFLIKGGVLSNDPN